MKKFDLMCLVALSLVLMLCTLVSLPVNAQVPPPAPVAPAAVIPPVVTATIPVAVQGVQGVQGVQTAVNSGDTAAIINATAAAVSTTAAQVAANSSGGTSKIASQVSAWSALISPFLLLFLALFSKKQITAMATNLAQSNAQTVSSLSANHTTAMLDTNSKNAQNVQAIVGAAPKK